MAVVPFLTSDPINPAPEIGLAFSHIPPIVKTLGPTKPFRRLVTFKVDDILDNGTIDILKNGQCNVRHDLSPVLMPHPSTPRPPVNVFYWAHWR
jgi:hypothetical protein